MNWLTSLIKNAKTIQVNSRVRTKYGKGTIRLIDHKIMCVEIDNEPNALYECNPYEVEKIWW
jgi:hypothetical protein